MSLSSSTRVGVAAIIENLLKRKWSTPILAYLEKGLEPAEIVKCEPDLSAHVLSERLRSMLRYRIVARYPQPPPSTAINYRLTPLGRKIVEILRTIEELDRKYLHRPPGMLDREVPDQTDASSTLIQIETNRAKNSKAVV